MTALEKIHELKPDESRLLYAGLIEEQRIEVREWEHYRWLQLGGDSVQSLMDLDALDQIELPNIKALLTTLLFSSSPKRLLNLGLGAVSLERYLDTKRPEIEIRSVESSEQVIQLAKDYFFLPERVAVIHDTAEHFLSGHEEKYDIILCDIFAEEMQPDCLCDSTFYSNVFKCINKNGILAINLLPESEQDVINILLPMKNHVNNIYLFEVPNHLNVIIYASNRKLPNVDELKTRANVLYEQTDLDLREMPEKINKILETV